MRKCAVVIGVNKTGGLPVLSAAASGAREFADWAKGQGFEVALMTDDGGIPVTLSEVKRAVFRFVQAQTFGQMVIYFSGHGILRGPDYELWLLSDAPEDPNEAVNVSGSIHHARNAGIPHMVVISDACRTRPDTAQLSQIQGGVIFPNADPRKPRPEVDIFYATLPGDPALEALIDDAKKYCGILTQCLLEGLRAIKPTLVEDFGPLADPRWVIPSWRMKTYLESAVPEAVSHIQLQLEQDPEIRVESHPPRYLATVAPVYTEVTPSGQTTRAPSPPPSRPASLGRAIDSLKSERFLHQAQHGLGLQTPGGALLESVDATARRRVEVVAAMDRVKAARGRPRFETGTGFTILGSDIAGIFSAPGLKCEDFMEAGLQNIRVHSNLDRPWQNSVLVLLPGGKSIPLLNIPDYIGTVVIEDGTVVAINYTPSAQTLKYLDEYLPVEQELEDRRSFAAVAARHGKFREESPDMANASGRYLRMLKSIDPTLGIFAAYAFLQAGNIDEADSVYRYMMDDLHVVPFDVALAANRLKVHQPNAELVAAGDSAPNGSSKAEAEHPMGPFCPVLTQGWAYLEPWKDQLPTAVHQVATMLVPGLFTMFAPEAIDILRQAFLRGEIA
jgi:Caspase domain